MAYNGILENRVLPTELCDNSLVARSMKEWFTESGIKELKLRPEPY